jgi:hypothetical protein
MLIGVPVAATPGLVPQLDVLDVTALDVVTPDAPDVVVVELELPQAASTMDTTTIAIGPAARRYKR